MPIQRELPPATSDPLAVVAWVDRNLRYIQDYALRTDSQLLILAELLADAGIGGFWLWQDGAAVGDPGVSHIQGNAGPIQNITTFSISAFDQVTPDDNTFWLSRIVVGDVVMLQRPESGVFHVYDVTANIIDQGDWFELAVDAIDGQNTNPQQDDTMVFRWFGRSLIDGGDAIWSPSRPETYPI